MNALLRLLGPYATLEKAGEVTEVPMSRPGQLALYLAAQPGWVSRMKLTGVFWPEVEEESAKSQLRVWLHRLRKSPLGTGLVVEAERVRWALESDVRRFRSAMSQGDWEAALELYQGALLSDLPSLGLPGFDGWVSLERQALEALWKEATLSRADELARERQDAEATHLLQRLLLTDPLAEDVVQRLLESYLRQGRRAEALAYYRQFRLELAQELALEPLAATDALAAGIYSVATPPPQRLEARPAASFPEQLPLSGRDAEIEYLSRASGGVLVTGEPGVGKSRLLAEALPDALWLRCREGLEGVPYLPLIETLRGVKSELPDLDLGEHRSELAKLLPELQPGHAEARETESPRLQFLEALAHTFEALKRPVILDDLQWLDPATLEVFLFLASRQRLALYGAYRTGELSEVSERGVRALGFERLELKPLRKAEVAELLAQVTMTKVTMTKVTSERVSERAAWLFRATGGNPFFVQELLRELLQNRESKALPAEAEVPERIAAFIRTRAQQLSQEAQRVLSLLCVLERADELRNAGHVVGLSDWAISDALLELELRGFLRSARFAHDITRQVLYRDLTPTRRSFLHIQAAKLLLGSADPLIVAAHYERAGQLDRAVGLWFQVAREGFDAKPGFEDEAQALYERILATDVASVDADRARAYLAGRYLGLDREAEATRLIETVLAQSHDALARSFALLQRAYIVYFNGQLELAQQDADEAARTASSLDDIALQHDILLSRAIYLHLRGEVEAALGLIEPVVEEKRRAPATLGTTNWLSLLASSYADLGRNEEALALYYELLELARKLGLKRQQVLASSDIIATYYDLGRIEEGVELAEAALALGTFDVTYPLRYHLALAYAQTRRWDEALVQLAEVLWGGSLNIKAHAYALQAEIYDARGQREKALEALNEGFLLVEASDISTARAVLAIAVVRYGSPQQQLRLEPILESLREVKLPFYLEADFKAALSSHLSSQLP